MIDKHTIITELQRLITKIELCDETSKFSVEFNDEVTVVKDEYDFSLRKNTGWINVNLHIRYKNETKKEK